MKNLKDAWQFTKVEPQISVLSLSWTIELHLNYTQLLLSDTNFSFSQNSNEIPAGDSKTQNIDMVVNDVKTADTNATTQSPIKQSPPANTDIGTQEGLPPVVSTESVQTTPMQNGPAAVLTEMK